MNTFVSHLECSYTGETYNKNEIHNLSNAGKPLLVKYYLDQIKEKITRQKINQLNSNGLWKYSFLLPVKKENRIYGGKKFPASGLHLVEIRYPKRFNIDIRSKLPTF